MTSWFDSGSTAVELVIHPPGPFSSSLSSPVFTTLVRVGSHRWCGEDTLEVGFCSILDIGGHGCRGSSACMLSLVRETCFIFGHGFQTSTSRIRSFHELDAVVAIYSLPFMGKFSHIMSFSIIDQTASLQCSFLILFQR